MKILVISCSYIVPDVFIAGHMILCVPQTVATFIVCTRSLEKSHNPWNFLELILDLRRKIYQCVCVLVVRRSWWSEKVGNQKKLVVRRS